MSYSAFIGKHYYDTFSFITHSIVKRFVSYYVYGVGFIQIFCANGFLSFVLFFIFVRCSRLTWLAVRCLSNANNFFHVVLFHVW